MDALDAVDRAGLALLVTLTVGAIAALVGVVVRSRVRVAVLLLLAHGAALVGTVHLGVCADRYTTVRRACLKFVIPAPTRLRLVLWVLLAVAVVIVWSFDRINEKPIPRRDTDTPAFD